jgi:hypothetical protein
MKIAIVNDFYAHFECLGFLLEILARNHQVTLVKNAGHSDSYHWTDYWKRYYSFDIAYNVHALRPSDYDRIIKLTASDDCLRGMDSVISIVHYNHPGEDYTHGTFLALCPYVKAQHYLFPSFRPPLTQEILQRKRASKSVALIGYFQGQHLDEDTKRFLTMNPDYTFYFVIWADRHYPEFMKYPNVIVKQGIQTPELISIVEECKYILSKKYINYDRFCGQLSLSVSFLTPLLADEKTAHSYRFPAITFQSEYSELGSLSSISDQTYDDLVTKTTQFREDSITSNQQFLQQILS